MNQLHFAARCAAVFALSMGASHAHAATYAVQELPVVIPAGHWSTLGWQSGNAIDAAGHVLAEAHFSYGTRSFATSERCSPESCKRLPPKNHSTRWWAMNEAGATAGSLSKDKVEWAGRSIPGQAVEFITHGVAYDINAANVTVGTTVLAKPFLYDTSLHILPTPNGKHGRAFAINDDGVVVGSFYRPNNDLHAFVYEEGVSTDLTPDLAIGADAYAIDINNGGVAVGCAEKVAGGPAEAVRFEAGRMTYLGTLVDGTRGGTCARAISPSGREVVGHGEIDPQDVGKLHGFVHDGTSLHDLNDLLRPEDSGRYMIYSAHGVNDKGQIAAAAVRLSDDAWVAVRLDPMR